MAKKRILVVTGGGDCPGLNSVIRAIVRAAHNASDEWEVIGSRKAFHGILSEPQEIIPLNYNTVAGLQVKGGTILQTTNKGNPIILETKSFKKQWASSRDLSPMRQRGLQK